MYYYILSKEQKKKKNMFLNKKISIFAVHDIIQVIENTIN